MKFELKTDNNNYSKSILHVFRTVFNLAIVIILCDVALKLGNISRNYQIEYYCRHLSTEKSKNIFKKLSSLSNLKSRQRIWEFCRDVVK